MFKDAEKGPKFRIAPARSLFLSGRSRNAGQKLCLGAESPREPTLIEATTTYPGVAAEAVVRKRKNSVITGFNRFGQTPLFVEIWPQLPKVILEVKFTDGIEVIRRDAQTTAERLKARLRGWDMPTQ